MVASWVCSIDGVHTSVIGIAEDCGQALGLVGLHRPKVLIVSHELPKLGGAVLAMRALEIHPTLEVIYFADDKPEIRQLAEKSGAKHFVVQSPNMTDMKRVFRLISL